MSSTGGWNTDYKAQSSSSFSRSIKSILLVGAVLALLLLGTCGRSAYRQYKLVDNAVARLHGQLDQAKYEDIYDDATDQFRNGGPHQGAIAFLRAVHEKMGASGKCSIRGLNTMKSFNYKTAAHETFMNATYVTEFADGEATESFTWRMDQDQPRLWFYRVDSPNLR